MASRRIAPAVQTPSGRGTEPASPATPVRQLGMGPIQVVPPGLMGLLQLKQTGRLPGTLSETVVGVIELRDWYLTARRLDNIALLGSTPLKAIAGGVLGNQTFGATPVAVPGNQIWFVEQLTVGCDPTGAEVATDLIRYAPGILSPNGQQQLVGPDVSDYQLAARTRTLRARADRGFWAYPSDQFIVEVFDNVSTNGWTFSLTFRATPCPV